LPDVEFMQGEDTLDLENRFADFTKRDVGGDALKEDVRSASDCTDDSVRAVDK